MQNQGIGKSKEDYLEAILMQINKNGACRATDIALKLKCSRASVSVALNQLEEMGFISRQEWRIVLTEKGKTVAEEMLSKHRFFKALLMQAGVSEAVAEEEACQMEHTISEDSFHKLNACLEKQSWLLDEVNKN